jgi:hypothetical protein
MREELEKKLAADYPELFADYGKSPMKSCMAFGCACGDGWEPVIRNLSRVLSGRAGSTNLKEKTFFPELLKLKVWFHNICRKIETRFNLDNYTLYSVSYLKYAYFSGYKVRYAQIKEKFGHLRVYTDIYPAYTPEEAARFSKKDIEEHYRRFRGYVDGAVSFAENMSGIVCETCGESGKLSTEGWWKVLCENCKQPKSKPTSHGEETIS